MERALFISVRPEFVEKIFNGTKTVELRKSVPKVKKNDTIIIYSSSPVMSIIGTCKVEEVISLRPNKLWNKHSNKLGIDKKRYFEYYEGKNTAVGIFLKDIKKIKKEIPLGVIRSKIENFHPPQTYRYFDERKLDKLFKLSDN